MTEAASPTLQKRLFSEKYYNAGKGKTRVSSTGNPLIRSLWNFCSYKRKGIDSLTLSQKQPFVLDLGSGSGAYSNWFLGKNPQATIIAVDWSFSALRHFAKSPKGTICRVCADAHFLPFKPETFNTLFSVDTLGHVSELCLVLDELVRVARYGAQIFLHSECSDYRFRWPDSWLIRKNSRDVVAELDGHFSLHTSEDIHSLYHQRFYIRSFFSPAGILGWLTGYPEKYRIAFKQARWHLFTAVTTIMALIKKMPFTGLLLRIFNAITNRMELFLGLYGGGSCFALLEKPPSVKNKNR